MPRLPVGKTYKEFLSFRAAISALFGTHFSGVIECPEGGVLLSDGSVVAAWHERGFQGKEALQVLASLKVPVKAKRYDEIDMKLAFDLLLSKLEILDDVVHDILQEETENNLSREELLRKYRIREPSEEEIERILKQME